MRLPKTWFPAALVLLLALCPGGGCGRREATGIDVSGTARLDGAPLEMGMVVFAPVGGGESKAGTIQPDGVFKLYSITPGRYRVAVQTSMFAGMAASADKARRSGDGKPVSIREVPGTFRAVPKRLEDPATSDVEVEVRADAPLVVEVSSK